MVRFKIQTRGSNQIKWASQKVVHSFLVLFALGCILIFPASDVSIVSQLLPFLQAYNKQRGICLLDLKNMEHQNCYDYSIHRTTFSEKSEPISTFMFVTNVLSVTRGVKGHLRFIQSNTLNGKYSYSWFLWSHKNLSYCDGHF